MMRLNSLDQYGTCSTVVLSCINAQDLRDFVKEFKQTLKAIEEADVTKDGPHVEVYYSAWHEDKKERVHCLRQYDLEDLAVVMATLVMDVNRDDDYWDDDEDTYVFEQMDKMMKDFGFKAEEKLFFNNKNDTSVRLYYMGAPDVVKRLAEFDDNGILIEKSSVAASEKEKAA